RGAHALQHRYHKTFLHRIDTILMVYVAVFSPDSGTTRRPLPEMVHTALTCQRWTLVQNAYIFRNFLCKSRFEIFPLWDLVWKVFVYRRSKRRARMDDTLE
uniref:Uncharacterized protein n=1 Tax=Neogobius melanostomus TaxID=47308 RepID=A0A8C6UHG9_9GOBI